MSTHEDEWKGQAGRDEKRQGRKRKSKKGRAPGRETAIVAIALSGSPSVCPSSSLRPAVIFALIKHLTIIFRPVIFQAVADNAPADNPSGVASVKVAFARVDLSPRNENTNGAQPGQRSPVH